MGTRDVVYRAKNIHDHSLTRVHSNASSRNMVEETGAREKEHTMIQERKEKEERKEGKKAS